MDFATMWFALGICFCFGYFLGWVDKSVFRATHPVEKEEERWDYLGEAVGNLKRVRYKDVDAYYEIAVNYILWRNGANFKINHSNDADTIGTLPSELSDSSNNEVFEFLLENYTPVVYKKNSGKSP